MRAAHPQRWHLAVIAVIVAIVGSLAMTETARSQQDEALHIYQLARALHTDNIDQQNYTYWVNGNIGKDLGLKALILAPGKPMPAFTFTGLNGTDTLDTSKLQPPYLINFWASWCPPCREEFPLLLTAAKNKQLTVPIYFVDTLDQPAPALKFLNEQKIDISVFTDTTNSAFMRANLQRVVPQTFLIDAQGNVQALHVGNMTPVSIDFFAEIATHPGLGAFDAAHPDEPPAMPTAEATTTEPAAVTPTQK